jgi:lysophospholipase L1-like esterase
MIRVVERHGPWKALWLLLLGLPMSCAIPPAPSSTGSFQVVALGDSFASGQGAPDRPFRWWRPWDPVGWADRRCNRSNYAPSAQAVMLLEQRGESVGLQSFACSGASIEDGLLDSQMGPEPAPGDLPLLPQVAALKDYAQGAHVDAVTIVAGGNDIYFQRIVMACMAFGCQVNRSLVDQRLAYLPALLDEMAQKIKEIPNLDPASVLLVEYPDPSHGADGSPCDRAPPLDALALLTKEDALWAGEYVLPRLNHEICLAARRNGFRYVGSVSSRFHQHGYCAQPQNFINSIGESNLRQHHYRGGLHPNAEGHRQVGERLAEVLSGMIAGQPPPSPPPCPPEPPAWPAP